MSFPDKVEREKCWSSRDVLWKCLDENPEKHEVCAEFRKLYESTCPSQWVILFIKTFFLLIECSETRYINSFFVSFKGEAF